MKIEVIHLRPDQEEITMTAYIAEDTPEKRVPKRQAIIIFPGGGYDHLSWRESEPIAMKFYAEGINAFVVNYSILDKARFPNPLLDASLAVAYVRSHAEEYNIFPDQIYVIGFSAGGHMAGMIGTMWHHEEAKISPDMPYSLNRPDGMIICYGVITMGEFSNEGSVEQLCGTEHPDEETIKRVSIHTNVDDKTVPAFMWHCSNDWCVHIKNALLMARALADNSIPFEFKVYQKGPHGISVGTRFTAVESPTYINEYIAHWTDDAIRWVVDRYPDYAKVELKEEQK